MSIHALVVGVPGDGSHSLPRVGSVRLTTLCKGMLPQALVGVPCPDDNVRM